MNEVEYGVDYDGEYTNDNEEIIEHGTDYNNEHVFDEENFEHGTDYNDYSVNMKYISRNIDKKKV